MIGCTDIIEYLMCFSYNNFYKKKRLSLLKL